MSGDGRWPTFEPGTGQSELSLTFLVPVGSLPLYRSLGCGATWKERKSNVMFVLLLRGVSSPSRIPEVGLDSAESLGEFVFLHGHYRIRQGTTIATRCLDNKI